MSDQFSFSTRVDKVGESKVINIPGTENLSPNSKIHVTVDVLEEALEDAASFDAAFAGQDEDIASLKKRFKKRGNALQKDLGRTGWTRFYDALMDEEQGLLKALFDCYLIKDMTHALAQKEAYKGWMKRRNYPIYTYKVPRPSKQSKSSNGGLYKIIVDTPVGVANYQMFFAKKHGKREEYEKTLKIQPLLAEITNEHEREPPIWSEISGHKPPKVSPIVCKDDFNQITIEPYFRGVTLTDALRFTKEEKERERRINTCIDELIEISQTVQAHRDRFDFLDTYGKGGTSFKEIFEEKFVKKISDNVPRVSMTDLVEKYLTKSLDEEDTVFCHGDAHTDNVMIRKNDAVKWIDWEYGRFSIPQMDLVKILKKAPISEETEERILRNAYEKMDYKKPFEHFKAVYNKTKIMDCLTSAAKYHSMSLDSKKHREQVQDDANQYFTKACMMINSDNTLSAEEQTELVASLTKIAWGKLKFYGPHEYKEKVEEDSTSPALRSLDALGFESMIKEYSKRPLHERIRDVYNRYSVPAATFLAGAGAAGLLKMLYDVL